MLLSCIKTKHTSMVKSLPRKVWSFATRCWIYSKLCIRKRWFQIHRRRTPIGLFVLLVMVSVGIWLIVDHWHWLASIPDEEKRESYSTTLRNVGLLFGGALALLLAFWRGRVADRQAKTAQEDVLEQRYQKGIEELGSATLAKRLGGIYELQRLADEYPQQYHVPVMRQFCAALRNPIGDASDKNGPALDGDPPHIAPPAREDNQALINAIGSRGKVQIDLEGAANFQLDLRQSDLRNINLSGANLTSASWSLWKRFSTMELLKLGRGGNFTEVKLCSAKLDLANLSDTDLEGACLCKAWLGRTDLSRANLAGTKFHGAIPSPIVSGAKLSRNGQNPAKGIRQSDLDFFLYDPKDRPDLTGVRDVRTNKPLRWRDEYLDDRTNNYDHP